MGGKKFLLLSDTHGNIHALKTVLTWAQNRTHDDMIRAVVFLGDGISDLRPAASATGFYSDWRLVRGNNDYESSIPDSAIFDFADSRFFLCHGHRHGLYSGNHSLIASARSNEADAALFGHTHVPYYKSENGILLINPGSISQPRSRLGATFAVVESTPSLLPTAEFWGIGEHGEIKKLKV